MGEGALSATWSTNVTESAPSSRRVVRLDSVSPTVIAKYSTYIWWISSLEYLGRKEIFSQ